MKRFHNLGFSKTAAAVYARVARSDLLTFSQK
jgi:hypothetical protein